MSRKFLILFVLLIFIGGFLAAQESIQERGVKLAEMKKEENKNQKIALVIGNASYKESPLKNPVNDATDIAEVLKKCGFEVTLKTNTNQLDMEKTVREFSDSLKDGGVGLFYFSGHGVQVEGINYLIPVNSNIQDEIDVKSKSVSANYILGKMDRRKDGMNIIILDACRINPYARSFRSPSTGLAQMDAPQGSLIVYATSPGKTADDGIGRNGIFTKHLLEMIKETPFEIMVLLRKVRKNVMDETNEKQIPWESSSLLGSFYFSYTDTQLEKTKAEISELESQIKSHEVQRQEFEKIKSEKEEREAARKEEEKKTQLKLIKLEEERLLKEKERQERLKKEEERLAQEEAQERTEREQQKTAAEERLNKLRQELSEEETKLKDIKQEVLSVDMARKEVEMLETKIKNIEALITQEKRKEIKQLEEVYDLLIEKLKNKPIPPKDQFESTADYEARVKKHQEKIRAIDDRYSGEVAEIQNKYYNEMVSLTKTYKDQKEELKKRKYPVEGLNLELLNYNADKESYGVKLTDVRGNIWYYLLSIKPDIARGLFERKELLKAEGYYAGVENHNSLGQGFIIDPISGNHEFVPWIKLRSEYTTISHEDFTSYLKQKGFFDSKKKQYVEFKNHFELIKIKKHKVVLDCATGLMWHQSGSSDFFPFGCGSFKKANNWIENLNKNYYSGYSNWRLPTLDEALSLLENVKKNGDLYIDPLFSSKQLLIWTGDKENPNGVWTVDFLNGDSGWLDLKNHQGICPFVRPVRSMQ